MFLRKKPPIIFIHGILGSMGQGILKGKGELHFGIAEDIYRPIINILESLGYKEDIDLFICYYDWTKKGMDSAKNYLIPTIEKAKRKCQSQKVDIISHSMGGIVARSYAQSIYYKNDIDKLIMIATPNAGSADAYFIWSGGYLKHKEEHDKVSDKLVKFVFTWYVRFKYKRDIDIEFIREEIPSVGELLPTDDYGNYLIYENGEEIDIKTMNIKNEALNNLNNNKEVLRKRRIKTYLVAGKNAETVDRIEVIHQEEQNGKWTDGKPVGVVKTDMGDGTVVCKSVEAINGKIVYVDSDHKSILENCEEELGAILNVKARTVTKQERKFDVIYVIIGKDVEIEINEVKLSNPKNYSVITNKMSDNISWTMIKTIEENNIEVKIISTQTQGKLVIKKVDISTGKSEEKIMNVTDFKQVLKV